MPRTDNWGIDDGYWDIAGHWHPTSAATHRAIRQAMGDGPTFADASVGHSAGDGSAESRHQPDATAKQAALGNQASAGAIDAAHRSALRVVWRGQSVDLPRGRLVLEDGSPLMIAGTLPPDLPCGYHQFEAEGDERASMLIVAPRACPLPRQRMWGWSAQLYAARSRTSWGFGDFADLRRLGRWAKENGAGMLMLNPLTAAAPTTPIEASPYFPSSRRFLSPLYLRIELVPGADSLGDELEASAAAGRALNSQRRIDRDTVFRLKMESLQRIYQRWNSASDASDRFAEHRRRFDAYCRQQGRPLETFAVYCALAERFGSDWRRWPDEYRRPESAAVGRFAADTWDRVRFHQWLQWVAEEQLADAGREICLVHDLPIGVDPGGADAWCWQDLLAEGCTIGAPPDAFNLEGQNWALPPFVPQKLRAAQYAPLRQTLAALMRRGGGLRIDHVMGLFRLFWIPRGAPAAEGAYVRYPHEEMLALVALEAERAGAFVVGEDLGTVEPHVRQWLAETGMLSFRLLYFESQGPEHYPPSAMAAVSTHDLPTLAGVWLGPSPASIDVPDYPTVAQHGSIRERLQALLALSGSESVEQFIAAVYRRLATAPSLLLLASLDDALAVRDQPNVPGTTTEWPNWSLALPGGIEALEQSALAKTIAAAMAGRSSE